MMADSDIELFFGNRKAVKEKLLAFGFVKNRDSYVYEAGLWDGQFKMQIVVSKGGNVKADVYDSATGDIYAPVKVFGAKGAFVGRVRAEYEKVLARLSEQCFSPNAFKSAYAEEVIDYAISKYGGELEFLWPKYSKAAILRRNDTAKWYATLLNIPKSKLGLNDDGCADVIGLRCDPSALDNLIDGKRYFHGYHMNKKHWFSICLDGSVTTAEICRRIDASYSLAKK